MSLPAPIDVLPHRAPFLFLDRCLVCDEDRITCVGCFEAIPGHFPGDPIVPGVLLIEGLAQTLAYWVLHRGVGPRVLLGGVDKARFRVPVPPGVPVEFRIEIQRVMLPAIKARGVVRMGDVDVATALITGAVLPDG